MQKDLYKTGGGTTWNSVCFIKAKNWGEKIIMGNDETLMMGQTTEGH